MSSASTSLDSATLPERLAHAEPSADWWRCASCGTNVTLRYRRRSPGACLNCGSTGLRPVTERQVGSDVPALPQAAPPDSLPQAEAPALPPAD